MKNVNLWKPAIWILCVLLVFFVVSPQTALANNVTVNSVSLADTSVGNYATVTFNLSQENSFGNVSFDGISFSDYIWVFVKYSLTSGSENSWGHCILAEGGTVLPENDLLGAFIRASAAGTGTTFTLRWNYQANGVSTINTSTLVKVCAIEMVFVPTGAFWYNAGPIGGTGSNNFGAGSQVLVNTTTQIPDNAATGWPNGYTGFCVAKYEGSLGQYCDYLNTIPDAEAQTRWVSGGGAGYNILYNSTAPYGSRYTTNQPNAQNRANNYISWADNVAYTSWTALRPLTEMEYEKAARGSSINSTNTRLYPWGEDVPVATSLGNVDGTLAPLYYGNWSASGSGYRTIAVGWYLSRGYAATPGGETGRAWTGASPYGIADLGGNVGERLINCLWPIVPGNGNGTTAPPSSWPAFDGSGHGARGGSVYGNAAAMRISIRGDISQGTSRSNVFGCRPARSGTPK